MSNSDTLTQARQSEMVEEALAKDFVAYLSFGHGMPEDVAADTAALVEKHGISVGDVFTLDNGEDITVTAIDQARGLATYSYDRSTLEVLDDPADNEARDAWVEEMGNHFVGPILSLLATLDGGAATRVSA